MPWSTMLQGKGSLPKLCDPFLARLYLPPPSVIQCYLSVTLPPKIWRSDLSIYDWYSVLPSRQRCKKTFSSGILIFSYKMSEICIFWIFATLWQMILKKCLFSSQVYSVGVEQCWNLFMPNMLRFAETVWKCPDFLPEMSGILDTRIPTLCPYIF